MNPLKKIRQNPTINRIGRNLLNSVYTKSSSLYDNILTKWWTSGVLDCNFYGTKFKLYDNCDDGLPGKFFYKSNKWHDHGELYTLTVLAKNAKCILDIGANTGVYSVLVGLSNPNAKIYAFEPYYINAERLIKNISLNNIKNVELVPKAVGSQNTEIDLSIPTDRSVTQISSVQNSFSEHWGVKKTWEQQKVPMITIDSFAKEINTKIDLIKCDVETFEMSVFEGMSEVLRVHKPTIIFETFLDDERRIFFQNILATYGYNAYFFVEEGLINNNGNLYHPGLNDNYLFTVAKPQKTFILYNETDRMLSELMP
jgi:FkbM family methyltransferase